MKNFYLHFTLLTIMIYISPQTQLSQNCRPDFPATNGIVKVICADENSDVLYIGGSFDYCGVYTGAGAVFSLQDGSCDTSFPVIAGQVNSSASDGNGGWYIGGDFFLPGNTSFRHLIHITASNSLDTCFRPEPDDCINSVLYYNGRLYTAGKFRNIGGKARTCIAALSAAEGIAYEWNPSVAYTASSAPSIYALTALKNHIYIGGRFNSVGDSARKNLARVDTSSSAIVSAWAPRPSSFVRTICISEGMVYFGGDFHTVNGISRKHIARLDTAVNAGPDEWNPGADDQVLSVFAYDGVILAGGNFRSIGGSSECRYMASLSRSDGTAVPWNVHPDSTVCFISSAGNSIIAGGEFHFISGNRQNHIALISGDGQISSLQCSASHAVTTAAYSSQRIFVGGKFSSAGGILRDNILSVNASTGEVLPWNPGINGEVRTIAVHNGNVFAGGSFTTAAGEYRNNIVSLDIHSGRASPWILNTDSTVNSIAVHNGILYLAGHFSVFNESARNRLAAADIASGSVLSWSPRINGPVNTIACTDSLIYAGGSFSASGSYPRENIAAFYTADQAEQSGKTAGWNPGINGTVNCIVLHGNSLIAGGESFSSAGGMSRNNLAAIDLENGQATAWNPGADKAVHSLRICGSTLYAAGTFTTIGGKTRRRLAAISLSGQADVSQWNPGCDDEVYTVAISGRCASVFAGGKFAKVSGKYHNSLAAFDDPFNNALPVDTSSFRPAPTYLLSQNYPNPFNPSTTINYYLQEECIVSLKIFDITGREISALAEGLHSRGSYFAEFDAGKAGLSSGVYFCRLTARSLWQRNYNYAVTKKLMFIK